MMVREHRRYNLSGSSLPSLKHHGRQLYASAWAK